ncbi:hypothetical protein [Streptomyces sp. CoH17]|uniref:hypothetical protein n=1 Tax=Streptomyces sp. CoH17 TaxID=2992806 RepID=UPI00226D934C|nr:hypothetical protein [Streptomyces sp. CoH17]
MERDTKKLRLVVEAEIDGNDWKEQEYLSLKRVDQFVQSYFLTGETTFDVEVVQVSEIETDQPSHVQKFSELVNSVNDYVNALVQNGVSVREALELTTQGVRNQVDQLDPEFRS